MNHPRNHHFIDGINNSPMGNLFLISFTHIKLSDVEVVRASAQAVRPRNSSVSPTNFGCCPKSEEVGWISTWCKTIWRIGRIDWMESAKKNVSHLGPLPDFGKYHWSSIPWTHGYVPPRTWSRRQETVCGCFTVTYDLSHWISWGRSLPGWWILI